MLPDNKKAIYSEMKESASAACRFLSPDKKESIVQFVLRQMNPDGGFRGRTTASDLYYTYFALECLESLNHAIPWHAVEQFLTSFKNNANLDLIHTACLMRCLYKLPKTESYQLLIEDKFSHLKTFKNGMGYRLSHNHSQPSIYATFLAKLALEGKQTVLNELEQPLLNFEEFKSKDGAFGDQPGLANGTTPVTAAAVSLFACSGKENSQTVIRWLAERQTLSGGFLATPYAPMPDLLSTATSLFALRESGNLKNINTDAAVHFIESLWSGGGYLGHTWDPIPDCEYTYYALLGLGCLIGNQGNSEKNDSIPSFEPMLESA